MFECLKKAVASVFLVLPFMFVFDDLGAIGESRFQCTVVFSFYVYCLMSLFAGSKFRLFHVLSLPVLTQFVQIFQKYDFTAGANSIWRLLPYLILSIYFINYFLIENVSLSRDEKCFLLSWCGIHLFLILISPNLERIVFGGIILYLLVLPLYFLYLKSMAEDLNFKPGTERFLAFVFVILGLGTFGLVVAGSGYKGSDNLLATRNITDTNVTMAYFILLWPFVIRYAAGNAVSIGLRLSFVCIFIGVVVFSFSRGAVFLVIPYLLLTLFTFQNFLKPAGLLAGISLLVLSRSVWTDWLADLDLTYFWTLRFESLITWNSVLSQLELSSGRTEIHNRAYSLFLQKPVTGHGIGSFELLGPGYREAHSLLYTLLAEEGLVGCMYLYSLFILLMLMCWKAMLRNPENVVLLLSFLFYLLFNHTVGSVFVVIPGNSITINCIAPILLMCLYFYAQPTLKVC